MTFELYQDFRGKPLAPELSLFGDKDGKLIQPGPDGLRITLPKDRSPLFAVGVTTTPGLRGDFEITATLEILQAEKPAAGYGVGVGMMVKKAAPSTEAATVCRLLRPRQGQVVLADRSIEVLNGKPKIEEVTWPCTDTLGRLRYKRTGSILSYQWAPGTTGDEFHEVHSCRFGSDDIERVSLSALTGKQPCALDVRLLEWRLRSISQAADVRPIAPSAGAPAGKLGLMAALVLVLLVGIGLALRWGRSAATIESSGATFHSLTCTGCGTNMKARAELAGKKVKCPRCGQAVRVPDVKPAPSAPSS